MIKFLFIKKNTKLNSANAFCEKQLTNKKSY
jgi:hypothetical protein